MVSKQQIAKLKEPSLKLVDLVTHEMMNMCKDATGKVRIVMACEHNNINIEMPRQATRTRACYWSPIIGAWFNNIYLGDIYWQTNLH
jgi:hypothetical protein